MVNPDGPPDRIGEGDDVATVAPLSSTDLARRYRATLEILPALQREIFRRHRIDGQTIVEIALALRIETVAVEHALALTLVALAEVLDQPG